MFKFGKGSRAKLDEGHEDLDLILTESIETSNIDFSVVQVARLFEEQLEYFLADKTTLDPRNPKMLKGAKHVITDYRPKAMAADIVVWHDDPVVRKQLSYDKCSLSYLAGHITCTAKRLFKEGRTSHIIRWGGNWDRDGVILQDQTFDDLPHLELYTP